MELAVKFRASYHESNDSMKMQNVRKTREDGVLLVQTSNLTLAKLQILILT